MLADFFIYFGTLIALMWVIALIIIAIRTKNDIDKMESYDKDDLFI